MSTAVSASQRPLASEVPGFWSVFSNDWDWPGSVGADSSNFAETITARQMVADNVLQPVALFHHRL